MEWKQLPKALLVVLGLGLGTSAPLWAQDQDALQQVVARVNGQDVTLLDVVYIEERLAKELQGVPPQKIREIAMSQTIDMYLVTMAGEKAGLEEDPRVALHVRKARENALREIFLEKQIEARVTEEVLQNKFNARYSAAQPYDEIRARHILVQTREEAQSAHARILEGEAFESVARAMSIDKSNAHRGGDLGWFRFETMVPSFAEAAFALEDGAVSLPVQSQFGWHLIKKEGTRQQHPPTFAEAKGQLRQEAIGEVVQDVVTGLRATADIQMVGGEAAQ